MVVKSRKCRVSVVDLDAEGHKHGKEKYCFGEWVVIVMAMLQVGNDGEGQENDGEIVEIV